FIGGVVLDAFTYTLAFQPGFTQSSDRNCDKRVSIRRYVPKWDYLLIQFHLEAFFIHISWEKSIKFMGRFQFSEKHILTAKRRFFTGIEPHRKENTSQKTAKFHMRSAEIYFIASSY